MLIFSQLKTNNGILAAASKCADSDDFTQYVNSAVERLMTRGNWWATVQKIQVCVYGGCITWPRYVGTLLASNLCRLPRPVQGNWYEFMPLLGGTISPKRGFGEFYWDGNRGFYGNHNDAVVTENDGWSPVFNQIDCNTGRYVRFYPRCQKDVGKSITIYGIDSNGQTISTRDSSGNWSEGAKLTLAIPFVSSPMLVRRVERVVKDITQCPVNGYQYDPVNDVLFNLAQYDPQETTPMYQHSMVRGFDRSCGCNPVTQTGTPQSDPKARQVTALVKLAFQPVVSDNDLVLIDNIAAIKLMIYAIRKEDAGDSAAASEYEAKAIHELNLQLRDKIPLDQVPVSVMSFGTAVPARHGIGRIL